jgi:hypothetical protein
MIEKNLKNETNLSEGVNTLNNEENSNDTDADLCIVKTFFKKMHISP